jgi:16S rRNA (cytosine967-C5)-methyltransferase
VKPPVGSQSRAIAARCLLRVEEGGFAHIVVPAELGRVNIDVRDRALVTALVYGVLRWQRRIDDEIERSAQRPVESLDPEVRTALRIGVMQLLVMDMDPHAAVATAVPIGGERKSARGFVNGVLRGIVRADRPPIGRTDSVADGATLAEQYSYPDWIGEMFLTQFGEDTTRAIFAHGNRDAEVTVRVVGARWPDGAQRMADAQDALKDVVGEIQQSRLTPGAWRIRRTGNLARLAGIVDGTLGIQDEGSQMVAASLGVTPQMTVVDLCAGPGGKASGILEMLDDGLLVAGELDGGRARTTGRHLERIGGGIAALKAQPLNATISVVNQNGTHAALKTSSADLVLVDAPCSGLGVMRRRPDLRWRVRPAQIDELAELQGHLLDEAMRIVRPGGRVVYSVCTVSWAETTGVIQSFLERTPDAAPDACMRSPWREVEGGWLLLGPEADTDGMFLASFSRAL